MEKIKPETIDPNEKGLEIKMKPERPMVEHGNLEKVWAESLFGNGKLLKKIKDAIELKNMKNEDPSKEIQEISKLLDESGLTNNLSILHDAIKQNKLKDLRESAFETTVYLSKFAEMDGRFDLLQRLSEIVFKNLNSAI